MQLHPQSPKHALQPAFRRQSIDLADYRDFTQQLTQFLEAVRAAEDSGETEEHLKNPLKDFLKSASLFANHYAINPKSLSGNVEIDLAIHNGKNADAPVGVLMEVKKPGNKAEMITPGQLNKKAFHEAVLYYLWEKVIHENHELKHIVITNLYEWFSFDAMAFNKAFYQDKQLVDHIRKWKDQQLDNASTKQMYELIRDHVAEKPETLEATYFDLREYEPYLAQTGEKTNEVSESPGSAEEVLTPLLKVLAPQHLLKQAFENDSNSLNEAFYRELLYILGLKEQKEGNKKLITRDENGPEGSLLENTISRLHKEGIVDKDELKDYGENRNDRLFNIGLALCITWMNRILFLKLLEAQLINYHQGDQAFAFMAPDRLQEFDDLNTLFFDVLAVQVDNRPKSLQERYGEIPYLNSSLFDPTHLELQSLRISNLQDSLTMPPSKQTVLKDRNGKSLAGTDPIPTLNYLLRFLGAYDFGSEGHKTVKRERKSLISASVLGLVFEKINGYREGSFFTPGFITMYMARETLRKTVLDKFNEAFGLGCEQFEELYNALRFQNIGHEKPNELINTLKICDPAVGSGHFLVSVLNELIAIKSELGILKDYEGQLIDRYTVKMGNDELEVEDHHGNLFDYTVTLDADRQTRQVDREKQRIQKALFHEKQTLIENGLFGVDLNTNSVKICRLRLWIELLKNAYYREEEHYQRLETLPNIDINIKEGNSLISRFPLDMDLQSILKKVNRNRKQPISLKDYEMAVNAYKQTNDRAEKEKLQQYIRDVKENFREGLKGQSPINKKLSKVRGDLTMMENPSVFGEQQYTDKQIEAKRKELEKLEQEKADLENNVIYRNAFEWRFEFPEVLDEKGRFTGFDVVIGNPPYLQLQKEGGKLANVFKKLDYGCFTSRGDIYMLFYEKGMDLLKKKGVLTLITSSQWMKAAYGKVLRKYLLKHNPQKLILLGPGIFNTATVDTMILEVQKFSNQKDLKGIIINEANDLNDAHPSKMTSLPHVNENEWTLISPVKQRLKEKLLKSGKPLSEWDLKINFGIKTGYNKAFIIDELKRSELIKKDPKSENIIKPILRGRDINQYVTDWAGDYLINSHNGLKDNSLEPINVENYPAVKNYLERFVDKLKNRSDQGVTPYNLRNCAYLEEFKKEKIIWKRIGSQLRFSFSDSEVYCLDSICIGTGEKIKYLTALLNSKLCKYQLFENAPRTGMGDLIISVQALNPLYVYYPTKKEEGEITKKVDKILGLKKDDPDADISYLQKEIDQKVYELYGLTEEEVEIVENSF